MKLQIDVEQKARDAYIVSPVGFLNSQTFEKFDQQMSAILDYAPTLVVMDMKGLEYLSSAGIRVIVKTRNRLSKSEGKLVFMNLQPQIKKVFDIINALPSMKIFASLEELDQYLDSIQKRVKAGDLD
jgi:anti-anti-sigma factor